MKAQNWMKVSTDIKKIREVRLFLKEHDNQIEAFGFLISLLLEIYSAENEEISTEFLSEDLATDEQTTEHYLESLHRHGLIHKTQNNKITSPLVTQQIDARKQHYEAIRQKRKESGRIGGIISGQIRNEAKNEAKLPNHQQYQHTRSKTKQREANGSKTKPEIDIRYKKVDIREKRENLLPVASNNHGIERIGSILAKTRLGNN